MGLIDKVKRALSGRSGQISSSIDKAVDGIDQRTGGKHRERLSKGADKVKETVSKLDDEHHSRSNEAQGSDDAEAGDADPATPGSPDDEKVEGSRQPPHDEKVEGSRQRPHDEKVEGSRQPPHDEKVEGLRPEPLDADLSDVEDVLPGAGGGPDTPPAESDTPIPPG